MSQLTMDEIEVNGRKRKIVHEPYEHTDEAFKSATVPAKEFYKVKYRQHSARTTSGANNLKNGMVQYARMYGTDEQADAIQAMDASRLQWMYNQRIIDTEEYFVYDDSNVSKEGNPVRHGKVMESTIQRYIEYYNELEIRSRAEIRESRRKG